MSIFKVCVQLGANFFVIYKKHDGLLCLHFFKGKVSGDNGDEKFGGWGVWWDQLPDETDFPLHTGPSKKTGTRESTYLQRHMSCLLYTKNM